MDDGMLYPVLHRLERHGYVTARWEKAATGRHRKYYRLTAHGQAQLAEERRQWQAVDVAELEDHLREQIAVLADGGLDTDEAFLVAVKRIGHLDALSREFAREHSDRLWKQLVLSGDGGSEGVNAPAAYGARRMWGALVLAVSAGAAIKVAALFGVPFDPDASLFYPVNIAFFILPFIAAYFAWERPLPASSRMWLAPGPSSSRPSRWAWRTSAAAGAEPRGGWTSSASPARV